jgi:hypothetical protein
LLACVIGPMPDRSKTDTKSQEGAAGVASLEHAAILGKKASCSNPE